MTWGTKLYRSLLHNTPPVQVVSHDHQKHKLERDTVTPEYVYNGTKRVTGCLCCPAAVTERSFMHV